MKRAHLALRVGSAYKLLTDENSCTLPLRDAVHTIRVEAIDILHWKKYLGRSSELGLAYAP